MSSLVGTHGMALATAMAVSGTVILFALCRPRSVMSTAAATAQNPKSKKLGLRPCIYSSGAGSKKMKKKKKKRVRFAEDVVVEFEAEGGGSSSDEYEYDFDYGYGGDQDQYHEYGAHVEEEDQRMPANRVALYNGILQARMQQRIPCSY